MCARCILENVSATHRLQGTKRTAPGSSSGLRCYAIVINQYSVPTTFATRGLMPVSSSMGIGNTEKLWQRRTHIRNSAQTPCGGQHMGLSPIKRVEYSDGLSNLNGVFGRCAVVGCRITAKRFRTVLSRDTPNSKGTGYDVSKRVPRCGIART